MSASRSDRESLELSTEYAARVCKLHALPTFNALRFASLETDFSFGGATTMNRKRSLDKRRILVVEDEPIMAYEFCVNLEDAGAVVIGPASSVTLALDLVKNEMAIDAALLDVNLNGDMAYPVAEALVIRSVPFIFTFGSDDSVLAEHYALMPRCQKPTDFAVIVRELALILPE